MCISHLDLGSFGIKMAQRKIYSIQTTAGKRYGIGLFEGKEMLKGLYQGEFKTKKGAMRKLKRL